jgi:hypothetical protein
MTYLTQVTEVGYDDTDFRGNFLTAATPGAAKYTYYIYANTSSAQVLQQTGQTNYLFNRGYVTRDDPATNQPPGPFPGPFKYSNQHSAATAFSTQGTPSGNGSTIVSISDGSSNTIFFMETNGGFIGNFQNTSGWLGMNWGHAPFYADFGFCPDPTNPNCDFSPQGRGYGWGLPSSAHAGNRIMTCFGDGSVRAISTSTPYTVFKYMCGANDGQIVTFDN